MKSFVRGVASVAILVTALLQGEALAAPITAEQAKKGMAKWLRARPAAHMQAKLGAAADVRTVSSTDGQHLFHIVNLEEGGFIVTPADDRIQPVIAFSDSGSVIEGDNPLWNMLNVDLPQRLDAVEKVAPIVKKPLTATGSSAATSVATTTTDPAIAAAEADWAELLSDDETGEETAKDGVKQPLRAGLTTLSDSDVRVPILMSTRWDQSYDRGFGNCFNYYTPNNYVCGCVATAVAQVMRYHGFPTNSVTPRTYTCWVDGQQVEQTMMGGEYDWSQMPETPCHVAPTDAERQAIGKLCYDVGVACRMDWSYSASSAATWFSLECFTNVFGYANARMLYPHAQSVSRSEIQNAIFANLDAGCPVILGIGDATRRYGHAIVADGYGVSTDVLYTHLNFGWSGTSDAWYSLPDIGTGYQFSLVEEIVYNVFPDQTGQLLTGRVTDKNGTPLEGVTVKVANADRSAVHQVQTNEKGLYAAHVSTGTWLVSATATGYCPTLDRTVVIEEITSTATVGNSWGNDFTMPDEEVALTTLDIVGPNRMLARSSVTYACTATFSDGTVLSVQPAWSFDAASDEVSFSPSGVLTVLEVTSDQSATLQATYTYGSQTVTATKTIAITPSLTLADGLDCPDLTFTTGGTAGWTGQTTNTHDTVDALQSGRLTGYQEESWVETTVTGPGRIAFWWSANTANPLRNMLTFSINGVQTNKVGGVDGDWVFCSYDLSSGSQTLRWTYCQEGRDSRGLNAGFLDEIVWTPFYTVTYKPGAYGTGATQTVTKVPGEVVTLQEAIFTRPGFTQTGWAIADGAKQAYALGAAYSADASVTLYPVWTQDMDIQTAVDCSSLTFQTSGSVHGWYGQRTTSHDGVDALQSGAVGQGQNSWVQTTVTGPGTLSFWWYANSESETSDFLAFSIDGVQTNRIGGLDCAWTPCSYRIPEGSHTLKWTYRRNASVGVGLDAGFLDEVVWTKDPNPPGKPSLYTISSINTSSVGVRWTVATEATSYNLYRSTTTTRPDTPLVTGLTGTNYSDTEATPGVTYYYWVEAVNVKGTAVSSRYTSGYRKVQLAVSGVKAQTFVAAGGTTNVSLIVNAPWTASTTNDWIALITVSGTDSGTFSYAVSAHEATVSRTGKITLIGGGSTDHPTTNTLTVTQKAVETLPALTNPTADQVKSVMEKGKDTRLAERITTAAQYADFRSWAVKVKGANNKTAGTATVMASDHAWLSYALGSSTLITAVPTSDQISVTSFEPSGTDGAFDFSVSLTGITIGSTAAEENLKQVFGLEGGADLGALSTDNVTLTFGTPSDGKVNFTAGPKTPAPTFFMRVKLTP